METWLSAPFAAADARMAPLTWGQHAVWMALARHGPGQVAISIRRIVKLPRRAPADVPSVLAAVGLLVTRHSSLRTRLALQADAPVQVVDDHGEVPVLVVTDDGPDTATRVAEQLAATPFQHGDELPQRVGLVVADGQVRHVVLVFSHTTVDFRAVEIVLRDLRMLLLRGQITEPAGLQSVDVADREQSEQLRRRNQRSVDTWVAAYAKLSGETLSFAGSALPGPAIEPRFQRAVLTSPAADTAARLIAQQHRVTSSTVLLAAVAAVHAAWSGKDNTCIYAMTNNRSLDGYADAIAKLNQLALVVLETGGKPSFAEFLVTVWQTSMDAYRLAYYDPTLMAAGFAAAGLPYASGINPNVYFNDIRLSMDIDLFDRATGEPEVRALLQKSEVDWTGGFDHFIWRTRIEVLDRPAGLGLGLTADTEHLPPPKIEQFLHDVERLLVEAAFRDVSWPWL